MKNKIFSFIYRYYVLPRIGKREYQSFFETLYNIGITGMNYGNGGDVKNSGELTCISYIQSQLSKKENLVLFDVGANVGDYSKALIDSFKNNPITLFAFEPSKKTFLKLKENIGESDNVCLFNFGFSNQKTILKLFSDSDLSGLASLYKRKLDHFNIEMNNEEEVELITIDEFCNANKIKNIDFLKLDVEGHELKVLQGAERMINSDKIKFIQFEFGGCDIDSKTYFQDFYYLLRDKYKFYRVVKNGLHLINNYNERLEIFTTINYLAELK